MAPLEIEAQPEPVTYDVLIGSLGYEQRSVYIPLLMGPRAKETHVVAFRDRHVMSYPDNLSRVRRARLAVHTIDDSGFAQWLQRLVGRIRREVGEKQLRVAVDISSMSRPRIAATVASFGRLGLGGLIVVDFLYVPAEYTTPMENEAPIVFHEPVLPEFAGWTSAPDKPVAAVLGLGYEPDKAVGVIEYLEPVAAWSYVPTGEDDRYDQALHAANDILRRGQPRPQEVPYAVSRPFDAFLSLESLVGSLLVDYRVAMVPMGPKVFALCSLLVAYLYAPRPSVWRFSSGPLERPTERVARENVVGLSCSFGPSLPSG